MFDVSDLLDWGFTESELFGNEKEIKEELEKQNNNQVNSLNDQALIIGNNALGIPDFIHEKLGTFPSDIDLFFTKTYIKGNNYFYNYGGDSLPIGDCHNFITMFYIDDKKFECFYNEPSKYVLFLKSKNINTIIMPNYSTYIHMPKVMRLFNLYKSRYVARFFQEAGFFVIPDVPLATSELDYVLDSIPLFCPSLAFQFNVASKTIDFQQQKIDNLRYVVDKIKPKKILVYAQSKFIRLLKGLNLNTELVIVESFVNVRSKLKGGVNNG